VLAKARTEGRVVGKLVYSSKKEADVARSVVPKGKGKTPAKSTKPKVAPKGKTFEKVLSPMAGNGFVAVELDLHDFTRVGLSDKFFEAGDIQSVSVTLKPGLFSTSGIVTVYATVHCAEQNGAAATSLSVAQLKGLKNVTRKEVKSAGLTFNVPLPGKIKTFHWVDSEDYGNKDRYVLYIRGECLGRDPTEQTKLEASDFMAVTVKMTAQGKDIKVLEFLTSGVVEQSEPEPPVTPPATSSRRRL